MAEVRWEPLTEKVPIGVWVVMLLGFAGVLWVALAVGHYNEGEMRELEREQNVEMLPPPWVPAQPASPQ